MKNEKVLESIAEGQAREYPILFSTDMVKANHAGIKNQTRRTVKNTALEWLEQGFTPEFVAMRENHLCPYGYEGDTLWVRETYAVEESPNEYRLLIFKASEPEYPGKWKPSIFLKRKDCRTLLKNRGTRIERLHDISERDAIAEGIQPFTKDNKLWKFGVDGWDWDDMRVDAKTAYLSLWSKINGDESTDSNPWVWVINYSSAVGAIDSKTFH